METILTHITTYIFRSIDFIFGCLRQHNKFLSQGLTSREARHLGPRLVRYDSLEPIQDGSGDTVFQGRVIHILVEAPVLGDPIEEGLATEDPAAEDPITEETIPEKPVLPNPTT